MKKATYKEFMIHFSSTTTLKAVYYRQIEYQLYLLEIIDSNRFSTPNDLEIWKNYCMNLSGIDNKFLEDPNL